MPVARETIETPPRPIAKASAAATQRRSLSSSIPPISLKRRPTDSPSIDARIHSHPHICISYFVTVPKRELSSALGVLHKEEGVPLRATFIVDPEGVIRFVSVNDLSVGRNVDEVLRVLDALQTDELCPCNWQKGEPTLEVA